MIFLVVGTSVVAGFVTAGMSSSPSDRLFSTIRIYTGLCNERIHRVHRIADQSPEAAEHRTDTRSAPFTQQPDRTCKTLCGFKLCQHGAHNASATFLSLDFFHSALAGAGIAESILMRT